MRPGLGSLRRSAARGPEVVAASALPGPAAAALALAAVGGSAFALTGSPLAGVLSALTAALAWLKPSWLLFLLVAAAPFARSPSSRLLPGDLIAPAKSVAALFLLLAWLGRRAAFDDSRPLPLSIAAFLFAWFSLTLLATVHAVDPALSARYLVGVAAGVSVFLVSMTANNRWHHRLVFAVLAVGAAIAALVALQYVIIEHRLFTALERFVIEPRTIAFQQFASGAGADRSYRPTGTMTHPNPMGLYFAVVIPFAFAMLAVKGLPARVRALCAAAGALMFAALLATNSRAALLTVAVAMALLCRHRGYRRVAAAGAFLFLAAALYYVQPSRREGALHSLREASRIRYGLSGRNDIWRKAADLAWRSPALGVGPGNFPTEFVARFGFFTPQDELEQMGQIWMIQTLGAKIVQNFNAHNLYLQLFAEAGLFAPVLFVAGVFLVIARAGRLARAAPVHSFRRAASLATAAAAAAMLVYGVFDSQIAITQGSMNLAFGALLGLGLKK